MLRDGSQAFLKGPSTLPLGLARTVELLLRMALMRSWPSLQSFGQAQHSHDPDVFSIMQHASIDV